MPETEITICFRIDGKAILEGITDSKDGYDPEYKVEKFCQMADQLFGGKYDFDWDWPFDNRIDIWVVTDEKK